MMRETGSARSLKLEAARWALTLGDDARAEMEARDWEELTVWLETAGAVAALEQAEVALARIQAHRFDLRRARAVQPVLTPWFAGAAALAAVAALALWLAPRIVSPAQVFRAPLDSARNIQLLDGTQVALNRGGELSAEFSGSARRVVLTDGSEAIFDVVHQDGRPFEVEARSARVTVTGTRFDVDTAGGGLEVAVSRGRVVVRTEPGRPPWTLTSGQMLRRAPSGVVEVASVSRADVGSWRLGSLTYTDAPLSRVAVDLARYWGRPVRAEAALSGRTFTGVLAIDTPERMAARLEILADVRVTTEVRGTVLRRRRGS